MKLTQINLLDDSTSNTSNDEWSADDWQTPNNVAKMMSKLILPSDLNILEPCAGIGQIAQFLPLHAYCNEIKANRYDIGKTKGHKWFNLDFLAVSEWDCRFDLIITNPPFSLCMEFIERSLSLLNIDNPNSRLIFLLPLDWNCPKGRSDKWKHINAHIFAEYRIVGRVAFLDKTGSPQARRQCSDAVFDIRPGKQLSQIMYLDEV